MLLYNQKIKKKIKNDIIIDTLFFLFTLKLPLSLEGFRVRHWLVSTVMKTDIYFFLSFTMTSWRVDGLTSIRIKQSATFLSASIRCRLFHPGSKRTPIGFRGVICQNALDRRHLSPVVGLSRACCLRPVSPSCLLVCWYLRFFGFNFNELWLVLIPEPPPACLPAARTSHRRPSTSGWCQQHASRWHLIFVFEFCWITSYIHVYCTVTCSLSIYFVRERALACSPFLRTIL